MSADGQQSGLIRNTHRRHPSFTTRALAQAEDLQPLWA